MGIYNKNTYIDRVVEFPNRYMETVNFDGTVTKTPNEGTVITEGSPLTVDKFNNLENGILSAHNQIDGNAETQNTDSIQKQVNALATKTQLLRADVLYGNKVFTITFTEKLMPGQTLRFVAKGEAFHLLHVNELSKNWTGTYLTASPANTKFLTKNWNTLTYATILSGSPSGQYNQGAHGQIHLTLDGILVVSVLQTIDSNISSGWDVYTTKREMKCSTLYPDGIVSLSFVNDSQLAYTITNWHSDTDGEIIGDLLYTREAVEEAERLNNGGEING